MPAASMIEPNRSEAVGMSSLIYCSRYRGGGCVDIRIGVVYRRCRWGLVAKRRLMADNQSRGRSKLVTSLALLLVLPLFGWFLLWWTHRKPASAEEPSRRAPFGEAEPATIDEPKERETRSPPPQIAWALQGIFREEYRGVRVAALD